MTTLLGSTISCEKKHSNIGRSDEIREKKEGRDIDCRDDVSLDLKAKMEKIVIPSVGLRDDDFSIALSYALSRTIECQPHSDQKLDFRSLVKMNGSVSDDIKINYIDKNVKCGKLISEICNQAGITWYLEKGMIVIDATRD